MPQSSHPLGAVRRYGTVVVGGIQPPRVGVNIGGDNAGNDFDSGVVWYCPYVDSYTPAEGDTVALVGIPGDWLIVGSVGNHPGQALSRYIWTRTANGLAAGSFIDVGTPPTTPWSTGSIVSSTTSRLTITRACRIDLYHTSSGQGETEMNVTTATSNYIAGNLAATQGGGVYRTVLNYSGLLVPGEVIDITFRNTTAGLVNLAARSIVTFADATALVAQT